MVLKNSTRLYTAANRGDLDSIREFLAESDDPNERIVDDPHHHFSEHERTALHAATTHHYVTVVRVLLEAGADPNLQDHAGEAPLHLCPSPAVTWLP